MGRGPCKSAYNTAAIPTPAITTSNSQIRARLGPLGMGPFYRIVSKKTTKVGALANHAARLGERPASTGTFGFKYISGLLLLARWTMIPAGDTAMSHPAAKSSLAAPDADHAAMQAHYPRALVMWGVLAFCLSAWGIVILAVAQAV